METPTPLPQSISAKDVTDTVGGTSSGPKLQAADAGPMTLRMALGAELRRLREDRGITRDAAGEAIRASRSKISRLESGRVGFKQYDLEKLLTLYGVCDETERAPWLDMARRTNAPGWWSEYVDLLLPGRLEPYLELEQAASLIRRYDVQLIPDLLQTPEYARALIRRDHPHTRAGQIDRRLSLLKRRQQILHRPQPAKLWAIVDEAAFRRPVGSATTMRSQLEHLIMLTNLPNVTIQMMPFWGHVAAGGPITILRFPAPEHPDVVYLEQLTSAIYLHAQADTMHYMNVMNRLGVEAEPPAVTSKILRRILKDLS